MYLLYSLEKEKANKQVSFTDHDDWGAFGRGCSLQNPSKSSQ